nr:GNAT family N-acetyltransferase [Klebsiella pneumoniae]
MREEKIVGSLAIDGEDLGQQEAHLRWFILDDSCRGSGIGRRLLSEAMAFCDSRQFSSVQLWTFKGLDAARKDRAAVYPVRKHRLRAWRLSRWGDMEITSVG